MSTLSQRIQTRGIDWGMVFGLAVLHIGALLAFVPAFFSWDGLLVGLVLFWLTGSVGISITYHRMLCHGSFKVRPRWVQYIMTGISVMAAQRGPLRWVSDHRRHHAHSDQEGDPHSPRDGFFWSHVFWLVPTDVPRDELDAYFQRWSPDLYKDPIMRWMDKYALVFPFGAAVALFFLGHYFGTSGMSWLVWAAFFRTVALLHITYFVNSASHTWGYRNYETRDTATNLWWVGLLGHGEGWHNNHHAFATSANFGHRWWELDLSYAVIQTMKLLGIAYDVKAPKFELAEKRGMKPGAGKTKTEPEQEPELVASGTGPAQD